MRKSLHAKYTDSIEENNKNCYKVQFLFSATAVNTLKHAFDQCVLSIKFETNSGF